MTDEDLAARVLVVVLPEHTEVVGEAQVRSCVAAASAGKTGAAAYDQSSGAEGFDVATVLNDLILAANLVLAILKIKRELESRQLPDKGDGSSGDRAAEIVAQLVKATVSALRER